MLIGSAGGAGINAQVDDVVAMCREIAEKRHFKLRVGCIYSDVDKRVILEKHTGGLIEPCGQGPPPLQKQDIEQSTNIVAQIGSEPFLELLSESFAAARIPVSLTTTYRGRERQCHRLRSCL